MRRIAALVLAGALGVAGTAALAGPAGAGMQSDGPFPVDAQLKIKGVTGFVGDNIFDTEIGQTLSTATSPGQKAIFVARAENEKFQRNRIAAYVPYDDCEGPGNGDFEFFYQGENVTNDVFSDNFSKRVEARDHYDLKLKVKVDPGVQCEIVVLFYCRTFQGDDDWVLAQVFSTQPGGVM